VVIDADADASTFVFDIDGEEKRVSIDRVTPAPRPTTTDTVPHPLLDGLYQRKPPPATADEYVVDKLLGLRQTGDSYSAKVRWFDYGSKDIVMDSTWIPTIHHVHVTGDGVIHANVSWTDLTTATAIKEVITVAWHKSTLPSMTRNFAYDPTLPCGISVG